MEKLRKNDSHVSMSEYVAGKLESDGHLVSCVTPTSTTASIAPQ